jgi:hypothetical protein
LIFLIKILFFSQNFALKQLFKQPQTAFRIRQKQKADKNFMGSSRIFYKAFFIYYKMNRIFQYLGLAHHRREFKHQLRILIIFTLGFTIAFSWRQTVFDISLDFIKSFINAGTDSLSILTSIFITVVSILLIYITSYFLKDDY